MADSFRWSDFEAGQSAACCMCMRPKLGRVRLPIRLFGLIETIRNLIERKPGGRIGDRVIMTLDDQQVPFAMADGRVRHEGLQLNVAGTVVRSSGSVGLDESLDLLIEVPLPKSWFKQEILAAALGGEVLRIPVRGTLDRPQFDQSSSAN